MPKPSEALAVIRIPSFIPETPKGLRHETVDKCSWNTQNLACPPIYHFTHLPNEGGMWQQMVHSCLAANLHHLGQEARTPNPGGTSGRGQEVTLTHDLAKCLEHPRLHHCLHPHYKRLDEEKQWSSNCFGEAISPRGNGTGEDPVTNKLPWVVNCFELMFFI